MDLIVVGIDGSEESRAALRFAIEEARLHGARIRAVSTWHVPTATYMGGPAPLGNAAKELEAETRRMAESVVSESESSGVEIEAVIGQGLAAPTLLAEAKKADLLVVGSRGLGGFRGLLLGSVSQQCALHSPCPIVIVPRHRDDSDANEASAGS